MQNDTIATHLLQALSTQKAGRLTFVPLNRICTKGSGDGYNLLHASEDGKDPIAFEQMNDNRKLNTITRKNTEIVNKVDRDHPIEHFPESISLAEVVVPTDEDPRLGILLYQIFSRGLVVESLEDASEIFKKEKKFTLLTLDGDRVDRRGAITGGYNNRNNRGGISTNRSPLELVRVMGGTRERIQQVMHLVENNTDENRLEREAAEAAGHLAIAESKSKELTYQANNFRLQLEELVSVRLPESQSILRTLKTQLESLEAELFTMLSRQRLLSGDYEGHLKGDNCFHIAKSAITANPDSIQTLEEALLALTLQATTLFEASERLRQELQLRIDARLALIELTLLPKARRKETLGLQAAEHQQFDKSQMIAALEEAEYQLSNLKIELDQAEKARASAVLEYEAAEAELESLLQILSTHSAARIQKNSRRALLTTRLAEIDRRIRELGHIPNKRLEICRILPTAALRKASQSENGDINFSTSAVASINRRAGEQLAALIKQREILLSRRKELNASHASIAEYISTLDLQKDTVVLRTFESLSAAFSEIFKTIVPNGSASLSLVRRITSIINPNNSIGTSAVGISDSISGSSPAGLAEWSGIAIEASFDQVTEKRSAIGLLSGGQKSLLACALILAIQRCDPAPFYLFDEVDANLDPQYRTALAAMIARLSTADSSPVGSPTNSETGSDLTSLGTTQGACTTTPLIPAQFLITTFRPELAVHAEKYFGISLHSRVSRIQEIDRVSALQFISNS